MQQSSCSKPALALMQATCGAIDQIRLELMRVDAEQRDVWVSLCEEVDAAHDKVADESERLTAAWKQCTTLKEMGEFLETDKDFKKRLRRMENRAVPQECLSKMRICVATLVQQLNQLVAQTFRVKINLGLAEETHIMTDSLGEYRQLIHASEQRMQSLVSQYEQGLVFGLLSIEACLSEHLRASLVTAARDRSRYSESTDEMCAEPSAKPAVPAQPPNGSSSSTRGTGSASKGVTAITDGTNRTDVNKLDVVHDKQVEQKQSDSQKRSRRKKGKGAAADATADSDVISPVDSVSASATSAHETGKGPSAAAAHAASTSASASNAQKRCSAASSALAAATAASTNSFQAGSSAGQQADHLFVEELLNQLHLDRAERRKLEQAFAECKQQCSKLGSELQQCQLQLRFSMQQRDQLTSLLKVKMAEESAVQQQNEQLTAMLKAQNEQLAILLQTRSQESTAPGAAFGSALGLGLGSATRTSAASTSMFSSSVNSGVPFSVDRSVSAASMQPALQPSAPVQGGMQPQKRQQQPIQPPKKQQAPISPPKKQQPPIQPPSHYAQQRSDESNSFFSSSR